MCFVFYFFGALTKSFTMVKRKQLGIGAKCAVFTKYLHPAKAVADTYVNYGHKHRTIDLLCIRKEEKVVNKDTRTCAVFRHSDFVGQELHTVLRWAKVTEEGPPSQIFVDAIPPSLTSVGRASDDTAEENQDEIPDCVRHATSKSEDVALIRGLGFHVDDDNDPAPENIPTTRGEEERISDENVGAKFEWDGICARRQNNSQPSRPKLLGLSEETADGFTPASMFLLLFPMAWLTETMLVATNTNLVDGKEKLTLGEFLRFLGLWFFMSTTGGFSRRDYWSQCEINVVNGAPYRLNQWMHRDRFNDILSALAFTNENPPTWKDKFWEVRQMIAAWNTHMTEIFQSSWVSCLDESMSIWSNRWTCPGWMFVPRKPHPFGNEYHSICCGVSRLMFGIELVEGKDRPINRPADPTNATGGTAGLLLRLCKPLFNTGKVVVLDSGFCVLKALITLKEMGVYAHAVIKKRRYWPKYVKGDEMDAHMADKEVGDVDIMQGKLSGIKYIYLLMKEPGFIMKLMSTYGDNQIAGNQENTRRFYKDSTGTTIRREFKYTTVFANHFNYRHAVDDHNNLRHSTPAFEETWITHRWPIRVFSFILAVTEVNAYLAFEYFIWKNNHHPTLLQHRRKLAMSLIYNDFLEKDVTCGVRKRKRHSEHELCTAPPHAKKITHENWDTSSKCRYQQFICKSPNCTKRVRTYCSCDPTTWICQSCFTGHMVEIATTDESGN